VPCNLPDGLALDEMLAPNSADRLHCQHSPSLSAPNRSKQRIRPIFRGSILDADPPAQGVKIARRITHLSLIAQRGCGGAKQNQINWPNGLWKDYSPVARGTTQTFKIAMFFDANDGNGQVQAWRDGVQIANYSGVRLCP